MYDATAKIPSGLLSGNVNQFGHYDLCMQSINDEYDINGQYCLASLQIDSPNNPYLAAIHDLVYAHSPFKSKLDDVSELIFIFNELIYLNFAINAILFFFFFFIFAFIIENCFVLIAWT